MTSFWAGAVVAAAGGAPPPKLANRLFAPPPPNMALMSKAFDAGGGVCGAWGWPKAEPNEENGLPPIPPIILEKSIALPG